MSAAPIRLCALDELEDGTATRFDVEERQLTVIRIEDSVYVIGDICSHQNVSLSDGGEVDPDECTIECPKHGSEFDLRTGEALSLPATKPVPTYKAFVADGDVLLELT